MLKRCNSEMAVNMKNYYVHFLFQMISPTAPLLLLLMSTGSDCLWTVATISTIDHPLDDMSMESHYVKILRRENQITQR
jgi:hypothetical protein